jgi:EmrB/QacA subfamily drug resistance transporter
LGVLLSVVESVRDRRRWWTLGLLCVAQFMVVLDSSVINVALPAIGRTFGVDQQVLAWVVSSYVLAFGGFLLLGGRLADLLGRRRMFVAGLIVFGMASLLGGFANSAAVLIVARVAQGLGAAVLSPSAMSIIAVTFDDGTERNRAYAAWGAVGGAGGAAGVALGGVLTQEAGWEWVLWINVPIVAACLLAVLPLLARTPCATRTLSFDCVGAATLTGGLALLVFALIEAPDTGWSAAPTVGAALCAVVLLAAFVLVEQRSRGPLVDLTIFRIRNLTAANVTGILLGAALMPMFFFLSLYLQNELRYSAIAAGLCLVPMCLMTFGVSLGLASKLTTTLGYKPVLAIGMALLAAGLAWFGQVPPHGSYAADILGPGLIAGAGLGLAFAPLFAAAATGVSWHQAGLASGLINTSQQIGGALGLALLSSIAVINTGRGVPPTPETLTEGYRAAFNGAAIVATLGMLVTIALIRTRTSRARRLSTS